MKYMLTIVVLVLISVSSAHASAFQNDQNKVRLGYIPYHGLLREVVQGVSGVFPSELPPQVAAQMQTPTPANNPLAAGGERLMAIPLADQVVAAYHLFADTAWTYDTIPTTRITGNMLKKTYHRELRLVGNNAFTGESYDSGKVEVAQQTDSTLQVVLQTVVLIIVYL